MHVGLTYDLRKDWAALGFAAEEVAEFDSEDTIAALEDTLGALGHRVERIGNVYALAERLTAGGRWDLVFNLCEGLHGRSREAQVPALLEAYGQPYTFSDPLTLALTLDKAMAKRVVRDAGIPTPEFFVLEDPPAVRQASRRPLAYPLFVKPVAEGTSKGITPSSVVTRPELLESESLRLLTIYRQPVLAETYLPGREFTVGIVGTGREARVVGVMEVHLLENAEPGVYTYDNKERCEDRVAYRTVPEPEVREQAERTALAAYRALGCRDAGRVDLRADARGTLQFLEVNPLAGLHPTHSDLPILCGLHGIAYQELIAGILDSAAARRHLQITPPLRSPSLAA